VTRDRREETIEVVAAAPVIAAHSHGAQFWISLFEAPQSFAKQRFFNAPVEPANDRQSQPAMPERVLTAAEENWR
jgi:hypothetical protein